MNWLRKKIINWLFGSDFVDYEELYNTYIETSNNYINYLGKEGEFIKSMMELTKLSETLIRENKIFIKTLKENGIDVDKINLHQNGENNDN